MKYLDIRKKVNETTPPGAEIYQIDGLYQPYAKHPSLFHDHYQANAYCDELFMKLDKEEEKKNEL